MPKPHVGRRAPSARPGQGCPARAVRGRRAPAPAAPSRLGFTLLELLIVVGIVGILLAMLAPVAGRVLGEAEMVECRNNLRNLGLAATHYADSHEGAFPVTDVLDGPHPELVADLEPYLGDKRCWYCPGETDPDYRHSAANLEAGRVGYFYYGCERATPNAGVSTFLRWNVDWPRRLTRASPPATWIMSDRWFSGEPTAHFWFKKGINYVTVDGRVGTVTDSPRSTFK